MEAAACSRWLHLESCCYNKINEIFPICPGSLWVSDDSPYLDCPLILLFGYKLPMLFSLSTPQPFWGRHQHHEILGRERKMVKCQWREYNAYTVVRSGHHPLPISEVIGAPEQTCPMQSRPSSVASLQCTPQRRSARQDLVRFCTPVWPHVAEHSLHFDHGDKNFFESCTSGPWITSVVCYWDAHYTYSCLKTGSCFLSSFYTASIELRLCIWILHATWIKQTQSMLRELANKAGGGIWRLLT